MPALAPGAHIPTLPTHLMTSLSWRNLPATALRSDLELQAQWDQLSAQRLDLPFMRADAVAAGVEVFGTGLERLLIASRSGRCVAMLILVPNGLLRWCTFQPSQLPLGLWVAASDQHLQQLGRSLLRGPLGFCLVVSISQVDPLQAPRHSDDSDNWHNDYIDTAWLDLVGDFDSYWAARGKNLRQNMRKQRNKLAADGVTTSLRVLRDPADMAPAIARYGALESAGWKAGEGTAIHTDNQQGRFYVRLFETAARQQEALVFEYLFNDRTAAINLCLLRAGTLVVLKTTYDESIPKTLSPAFLLREDELKHLFAGHEVKRVEYYGRRMDWHTKLTEQQRTLFHLTTYRWPLVKHLAVRRRAGKEAQPAAAAEAAEVGASATPAAPPSPP